MARDGMADLITFVRNEAQAGTALYTIDGVAYFTDDQIQERLDRTRVERRNIALQSVPTYTDGTYAYHTYQWPEAYPYIEDGGSAGTTSADSGWRVYSSDGSEAPAYAPNYAARQVVFTADTDGTAYYADFRTYDPYTVIADIWETKAANIARTAVKWSTDNHSFENQSLKANYLDMAKAYREKAGSGGINSAQLLRSDMWGW